MRDLVFRTCRRSSLKAALLMGILGCLVCVAHPAAAASEFDPAHDLNGEDVVSHQYLTLKPGPKGEVVIFMSAKCPCSNSHVGVVKDLAARFPDLSFVVVHSNTDEDASTTESYFKKAAFGFPVIQDQHARLANQLKAFKTPHAFVIGRDGQILYRGGVTSSASASPQDRQYLREALEDVQNGRPVHLAHGRTLGCAIAR